MDITKRLYQVDGQALPRPNPLAYNRNTFDPTQLKFLDRIGANERTLYPLQYIQADGTGYFVNSDMVTAGRTITSTTKNGTTTLSSPSAGRLNAAAGTLWDFTITWSDAVVSSYRFCSKTAANAGIVYDVSGAGRHLTATDFADINTVCASGRTSGSDTLNLHGYTTTSFAPIPAQTANPSLDALGNALTSTGRAKYSIVPKGRVGNCAKMTAGSDGIATTITQTSTLQASFTFIGPSNTGTFTIAGSDNYNVYLGWWVRIVNGYIDTFVGCGGTTRFTNTHTSAGLVVVGGVNTLSVSISSTAVGVVLNGVAASASITLPMSPHTSNRVAIGNRNSNNGTLFTSAESLQERIYNVNINGVQFPLTEGSGTTVYGYGSNGTNYTGTITASDINAFWAGKQTTYYPSLQYGCSIGRWSPVDNAYKDEVSRTNKCTCVKANPTVLTNTTKGGDAASVLSVVSDSAALAAAGLSHVCTSGNAYKLDNSAGASFAYVQISGGTGNTNPHSISFRCRAEVGTGRVQWYDTSAGAVTFSNTSYQQVKAENLTPGGASYTCAIRAEAGAVVYFILPQLEEGSTATSPIIGADTAAAATEYNGVWPANPYTGLDCRGKNLTAQPLKFNASSLYSLADAQQVREATGWTYGNANTFYNADGTQIELTLSALDAAGTGPRFYLGTKGTALYSVDQVAKDAQIEKLLKV